jgi:hypothetical protein
MAGCAQRSQTPSPRQCFGNWEGSVRVKKGMTLGELLALLKYPSTARSKWRH